MKVLSAITVRKRRVNLADRSGYLGHDFGPTGKSLRGPISSPITERKNPQANEIYNWDEDKQRPERRKAGPTEDPPYGVENEGDHSNKEDPMSKSKACHRHPVVHHHGALQPPRSENSVVSAIRSPARDRVDVRAHVRKSA
jgi:hypothetical protein